MPTPPRIKRIINEKTEKSIQTANDIPLERQGTALYKESLKNNVYAVQGIDFDDIDVAVINKIKEMFLEYNGSVPVYDFSKDRFVEQMQSWQERTDDDSFKLPFINVSRQSAPKMGTNDGKIVYNIPGNSGFNLFRLERTDEGGNKYYEIYKTPQPINIDLEYDLGVFASTMRQINQLDKIIISNFQSAQVYVKVNQYHYMALTLDAPSEDNEESIEKRRYFEHVHKISLKGYIIEKEKITMRSSAKFIKNKLKIKGNDTKTCEESTNVFKYDGNGCLMSLNFMFKRKSGSEQEITLKTDITINYANQDDDSTYSLQINGVAQNLPVNANTGDILKIINNTGNERDFLLRLYVENQ